MNIIGGIKPYSYSWSNGAKTEDLNSLRFGKYQVTVTDSNGCEITKTIDLIEPPEAKVSANITNVSCYNGRDGAADLDIRGGSQPFSFNWSNGTF